MQNLTTIITLASASVGLFVTAVTFIGKFIRSAKAKKQALQTIRVCDAIVPFIRQAEEFTNYGGQEKKEFVMTKVNQFAIQNKIHFNAALIGDKIEELVRLTKEVNKREKDTYTQISLQNEYIY